MNKVVLITGCSSGFGYLTALTFARKRYKVFATVRNIKSDGASKLREIQKTAHLDLTVIAIDVNSDKSVENGVQEVINKAGKIDILINNAGFMYLGAVEDFAIEEIIKQYQTNVFGYIRLIKFVAPYMRTQKSGLIINISSINGLLVFPLYGIYASSKFAVESLSEALRFELAHFGIKVILVEPGTFDTDIWQKRTFAQYANKFLKKESPYQKLTEPFFQLLNGLLPSKNKNRFFSRLINPQKVANKLYELAQQSNPPMRNVVGIDAQAYLILKKILPRTFQNWLLRKIYHW